jgi:hypothetical protein
MTEFEAAVLLVFGCMAGLLLLCLWIVSRMMRPDGEPSGVDPILGARDRVAIYRPGGPFIRPHRDVLVPMPEHLTTQEEMVAWMTKELPRVIENSARSPE